MAEGKDGPNFFAQNSRDEEVRLIRLGTAAIRRRTTMFASGASRFFAKQGDAGAAEHFAQAADESADAVREILTDVNKSSK